MKKKPKRETRGRPRRRGRPKKIKLGRPRRRGRPNKIKRGRPKIRKGHLVKRKKNRAEIKGKPKKLELAKKISRKIKVQNKKLNEPILGLEDNMRKSQVSKESLLEREKEVKKSGVEDNQFKDVFEGVHQTRIKVLAIGGGASTIIAEIATSVKKSDFCAANTDGRSLNNLPSNIKKFQFGLNTTKGLGTGMNPGLGKLAAAEDKEKIKEILEGQDLTIILACLGGGTSSGATSTFAGISKSLGNITYGIFTLPFEFEGEKKMEAALSALEEIRPHLDVFTVIPNENIFKIVDKNTPLKDALSAINKRLAENLEGLVETIYCPGLINIDFADLRAILTGKGRIAYLNTVELERTSAEEINQKLISSPIYPYTIKGAKGVLYNITSGRGIQLNEVSQISNIIMESANKKAKIIFGVNQNTKYTDKAKIMILATGCSAKEFFALKNISDEEVEVKKPVQRPSRVRINAAGKEKKSHLVREVLQNKGKKEMKKKIEKKVETNQEKRVLEAEKKPVLKEKKSHLANKVLEDKDKEKKIKAIKSKVDTKKKEEKKVIESVVREKIKPVESTLQEKPIGVKKEIVKNEIVEAATPVKEKKIETIKVEKKIVEPIVKEKPVQDSQKVSENKEEKISVNVITEKKVLPPSAAFAKSTPISPEFTKVRRNGLQVKREMEEAEKEFLEQEKMWDIPAILRKKKNDSEDV